MRCCERCGACFEDAYDLCSFDGELLRETLPGSRVLGGRYLLEQRVASGAMGVVFRATHVQLGSTVAVKLMRPRREELRVGLARFHREAQILGQIKHPNAVLVMDFGVEERAPAPFPYLVTEYLRGEPLSSSLARRQRAMSLVEAERIVGPLCEAVEEAHEVGVIHRDIKPSNIFLEELRDKSHIVKVLDFGIAKFVELSEELIEQKRKERAEWALSYAPDERDLFEEVAAVRAGEPPTVSGRLRSVSAEGAPAGDGTVTEAGFMIGTIPYMAPEQMTGERVSRRTDVYAVATVLFELLSGRLPFEGEDDDIIAGKVSGETPSLVELGAEVPAELDALVGRALAVEPSERPARVLDVARALRDAIKREQTAPGDDPLAHADVLSVTLPQLADAVASFAREQSEVPYSVARDRILSLSRPMTALKRSVDRLPPRLEPRLRDELLAGAEQLERGLGLVLGAFHEASAVGGDAREYLDYLRALFSRQSARGQEVLRALGERCGPPATSSRERREPAALFAKGGVERSPLVELAQRLSSGDLLDSDEAFQELMGGEGFDLLFTELSKARSEPGELVEPLVRGLWRHADELLLRELYPASPRPSHGMRLLPLLASLDALPAARPFLVLSRIFAGEDEGGELERALQGLGAQHDERVLWRCLLVHPAPAVFERAMGELRPAELWSVISHPGAPVALLARIFRFVDDKVGPEFKKVYLLCAAERLRAPLDDDELVAAFRLLASFFAVPCFHEDVVFEPLLELDALLRGQVGARGLSIPDEATYVDGVAAFAALGATDSVTPEAMKDIPLPIQRKLAREGHFLAFFVTHSNERVAKETLVHLFRLEDITRYLRLPKIHRAVLVELARRRRFFRKEAPRLALLHNPKTPAHVARPFIPLLAKEQLTQLAQDRHASAEVRQLAASFVERLKTRHEMSRR